MDDSRRIFLNNEDNKEMLQGRINEVTKSPSYDELEKFQYTETSSKLDPGSQSNLSFRPISPENGEEKNDKTVSTNAIGELRIPKDSFHKDGDEVNRLKDLDSPIRKSSSGEILDKVQTSSMNNSNVHKVSNTMLLDDPEDLEVKNLAHLSTENLIDEMERYKTRSPKPQQFSVVNGRKMKLLSYSPTPEEIEQKKTTVSDENQQTSNKLLGADKSLKDFGHGTLTNNVDETRSYQTQNETFQISQQEQVETYNTPLIEQEFKRDFQDKVSQKHVNTRYQSDPFQLHYDRFHAPISTQSYEHIARCAVKPYKTRIYELKQFQTQSVYHATVKTNVREKPSNLKPNENNTNSKVQVDENIDEPELTMEEDSETIPITENNTFIDFPSNNQRQKKNEEFGRPQNVSILLYVIVI